MSTTYRQSSDVPNKVLADRLKELAHAVADGKVDGEFTMRVPAELDRDADFVLSEAARRITALAEQVRELREENERGVLEIDALRGIVSDWLEFCLNPNRGNNQQADPLDRLMILITKSKKATLEALNAMGYGFDIPAGAKITGIVLETRKK